jgi:uncharacterized protein
VSDDAPATADLSRDDNDASPAETIELFPLRAVLLPDGLLALRVFEARYLDLVTRCLRSGRGFGVIALRAGEEVRRAGESVELESMGCVAEIVECDATETGLLQLRCRGTRRFVVDGTPTAGADGLWSAPVRYVPDDAPTPIPEELGRTARALEEAFGQLTDQGVTLHLPPERFDDATWVAYRWAELLSMSNSAKLALMQWDEPLARLRTIDHILHQQAQVSDLTGEPDAEPPTLH